MPEHRFGILDRISVELVETRFPAWGSLGRSIPLPEEWFPQLAKICQGHLDQQHAFTKGEREVRVSLTLKIELQSDEAENAKALAEANALAAEMKTAAA